MTVGSQSVRATKGGTPCQRTLCDEEISQDDVCAAWDEEMFQDDVCAAWDEDDVCARCD